MFKPLQHSLRLLHIAVIVAGVNIFGARQRKGQRLAVALEKLGPAFIKLGQVISTRSDVIGEEMAEDLSHLRDALPPFASTLARVSIEAELGKRIGELFSAFDDRPVAAASIAQVHRAVLKDGKEVAIKILRPNIEKRFTRDLDLLCWLASHLQRRYPRLKPVEVVRTLKESVFMELDLRFEAAAATELADNMRTHAAGMRIPAVHWPITSRRVMVMEWVEGIALDDVATIKKSGFDVNEILAKAAQSLFAQVFKDGFFHADLHPGNLFVDKNGDLVAVDFGIMGRLDIKSRLYMAEILRGFLVGDYRRVAEVHFTAGYVPRHKSVEAFTQACMAVAQPIMGKPLNEISVAKLLGQMFAIATEFEMETQPQLLLLQKTMMVTEGVGRMLNPSLNMWELARPMIEDWANEQFGLQGKLKEAARQSTDIAKKLPEMLWYIDRALKHGITLSPQTIEKINEGRRNKDAVWSAIILLGLIALMALWH